MFTSKSTTGMFLVMQGQNGTFWPIHWYARRQKCVSRSTTEAETVALAEGAYEDALPSMFLLDAILPSVSIPLVVLEDNQAVIQVVEKGFSVKLRHLPRTQRLSIAALSEIYSQGQHFLRYVESAKQLADILTKALERQKFVAARHAIGLQPYATKGH